MATEGGDRGGILARFDETAPKVFACLCRLTAGDAARALELLVLTYASMAPGARHHDVTDPFDAAGRVYIDQGPSPHGRHEIQPVASLTTLERIIAELDVIRRRSIAEIASAIGKPVPEVEAARATVIKKLSAAGSYPIDELRRCEVWFDDSMLADARLQLVERFAAFGGNPELVGQSHRRTNVLIGVASAIVGAALVVWVIAANRSDDDAPAATDTAPTLTAPVTSPASTVPATTDPTSTEVDATDATAATDASAPGTATNGSEATPTTADARPVGFVIDPLPDGFVEIDATDAGSDDAIRSSWQGVWTSEGATRTSGRWFRVLAVADHPTLRVSSDRFGLGPVFRFQIAGRNAQLVVYADGVQHTTVRWTDERLLEFDSFGMAVEQLAALVDAATLSGDGSVEFGPTAASVLSGLNARTATSEGRDLGFFRQDFAAFYGNPNRAGMSVASGVQRPNDLIVAALLLPPSTDPAAPVLPARTIEIGGAQVLVGQQILEDGTPEQVLMWHEGGQTILVRSTLALDLLLPVVERVRPASVEEWRALHEARPDFTEEPPLFEIPADVHVAQIGSAVTRSGSRWMVTLADSASPATFSRPASDGHIEIAETRSPPEDSFPQPESQHFYAQALDPAAALTRFESLDDTVIVLALRGRSDAAFMRVTVGDTRRITVRIVAVEGSALSGSAYAYSEVAPFSVDLLDADGAVIETLAS